MENFKKKQGKGLTAAPLHGTIKCFHIPIKEKPGLPRSGSTLPHACVPGKGEESKTNNATGCAEKRGTAEIVQNDGETARCSLHPVENL